jgi:hypothetical protein
MFNHFGKFFCWLLVFTLVFSLSNQKKLIAQTQTVSVGIRLQKSINFYLENGFSVYYDSDKILSDKVLFGFHYVSSRLGSAINSNAIKQDRLFLSTHYIIRPKKKLNILTGIDLGYFHADYEEPIFDDLQNQSFLFALEAGIRYNIIKRISINSTLGYNLITGDGTDGAGTLYPLYFQISVLGNFQK